MERTEASSAAGGKRVSLSKKQLETATGAELLKLCESIKLDGDLSKHDIVDLAKWLRTHQGSDLPAVVFLSEVVERIIADKRVTAAEMAELRDAIERVLPRDARKAVVENRKAIEREAKQRKREKKRAEREAAKQADRERREREAEQFRREQANRPRGFHSKVSGVTQENDDGTDRQSLIRDHVHPGMTLIHKREPHNPYDEYAIALWIKCKMLGILPAERKIGYLNQLIAEDLAPYLDRGGWARITVKEVTGGGDRYYGVNIFIEDGSDVR